MVRKIKRLAAWGILLSALAGCGAAVNTVRRDVQPIEQYEWQKDYYYNANYNFLLPEGLPA